MKRIAFTLARPTVIGPIVVLLVASAVGALALRASTPASGPTRSRSYGLISEPEIILHPPLLAPTTPAPKPKPRPKPKPKPVVRPAGPSLVAFRGLGAWVDLYDYAALDPETAAADMSAHGARTLYLQTARWDKPAANDPGTFADPALADRWVTAAHAHGMRVVGWYLPAYDDMTRDVDRTRAIASFRTRGAQAFDALAIDIEYRQQMPSISAWNTAVAQHIARVRAFLGPRYPIAAIVPAPLAMEIRPTYWVGFPWAGLAASANLFMPMAYWSYRHDCTQVAEHCAYGYTKGNIDQVRALTGKANVPVHVLGGVADSITTADVAAFVAAAKAAGAYGGSLYDYRTTQPAWWGQLAKLN